jgi:hypothetical protein
VVSAGGGGQGRQEEGGGEKGRGVSGAAVGRTGDGEAEGVGVGGEEAFEEGGFAGAGGAGDDYRAGSLRGCWEV